MYQKVAIAIIKPGLGTITDCLLRGITIVTYTRGQNKEFTENAKILEDNNIGINFSNLASAIDFSLSVIKDKNFLKNRFEKARDLRWNGEKEVIRIIEKTFNNKLLLTK